MNVSSRRFFCLVILFLENFSPLPFSRHLLFLMCQRWLPSNSDARYFRPLTCHILSASNCFPGFAALGRPHLSPQPPPPRRTSGALWWTEDKLHSDHLSTAHPLHNLLSKFTCEIVFLFHIKYQVEYEKRNIGRDTAYHPPSHPSPGITPEKRT